MENNNEPAPQAPQIPESEMKLPEEQFGPAPANNPQTTRPFSPLLIALLVILLIILAAVILWGEAIVGLILPETKMELPPLPEPENQTTEQPTSTESDMADMEAELNATDMSSFDADMAAIEAELDAEASSSATTTP